MINAGIFDKRISVLRPVHTPDALGGSDVSYEPVGNRWANISVPRARDNILAMQDAEIRTHVVTVRDRPAPPVMGDIITCHGLRLKVLSCRPDIDNGVVYLDCESYLE